MTERHMILGDNQTPEIEPRTALGQALVKAVKDRNERAVETDKKTETPPK